MRVLPQATPAGRAEVVQRTVLIEVILEGKLSWGSLLQLGLAVVSSHCVRHRADSVGPEGQGSHWVHLPVVDRVIHERCVANVGLVRPVKGLVLSTGRLERWLDRLLLAEIILRLHPLVVLLGLVLACMSLLHGGGLCWVVPPRWAHRSLVQFCLEHAAMALSLSPKTVFEDIFSELLDAGGDAAVDWVMILDNVAGLDVDLELLGLELVRTTELAGETLNDVFLGQVEV